jgi:NAD(P)-dependent dehydrogenase (short-subunit alcohol dehydrogenase family)
MDAQQCRDFDLGGKVAVVTGAGRGLGFHFALALARYGADVVVCSRTVSELETVAGEIEKLDRRAMIQRMDIRHTEHG